MAHTTPAGTLRNALSRNFFLPIRRSSLFAQPVIVAIKIYEIKSVCLHLGTESLNRPDIAHKCRDYFCLNLLQYSTFDAS